MEVAALSVQQSMTQSAVGMSMLKQQAKAEQAIVALVQQAAAGQGRGQNLDISV